MNKALRKTCTRLLIGSRLLSRRRIDGGHWLWDGACDRSGYGLVRIAGRLYRVHAVALYAWGSRELDGGSIVMHNQDVCTLKHCFNPAHLQEASTRSQQFARQKRGLRNKLTAAEVRQVRELGKSGTLMPADIATIMGNKVGEAQVLRILRGEAWHGSAE